MKMSHLVEFYIYVLGLVAAIEAGCLGYVALLLYYYPADINKTWPLLLLLTAFLLLTLRCILYEFRFLSRLRTDSNVARIGATVAFWLGLIPLLPFIGLLVYAAYS